MIDVAGLLTNDRIYVDEFIFVEVKKATEKVATFYLYDHWHKPIYFTTCEKWPCF